MTCQIIYWEITSGDPAVADAEVVVSLQHRGFETLEQLARLVADHRNDPFFKLADVDSALLFYGLRLDGMTETEAREEVQKRLTLVKTTPR